MENPGNTGNSSNQSRFLIAAVLSMAILFGWQYFFAPKKPADNSNTAVNTNTAAPAPAQPTPAAPAPQLQPETAATTPDTTPNKQITIKTPLYEVKLDSKGALATSWILLQSRSPKEERPLYADGSTSTEKKPLQLISPEAAIRNPRELPFRLSTDDAAVNALVNDRNYAISGGEETIELAPGQEKQVEFNLTGAGGLEVT